MGIQQETKYATKTTIFTYGTLKRGFSNHTLMQDLIRSGDAIFKGTYTTAENYPLVCGPYRVPFLLNIPGSGQRVTGEIYEVTSYGLTRMDELEGTSRGHYERLPIKVVVPVDDGLSCAGGILCAEAYFAHRSYGEEMWKRNGKRGLGVYSEKETIGYVKRNDRPKNMSFLDHIRVFLSTPSN